MSDSPHDRIFKATFERPESAAQLFRARFPKSLVDAVDWSAMVGVPGSFVGHDLRERHTDLLFSAPLRDEARTEAYLYLLLEHQSSNDPDMPFRMLVYMTRIWERFRKNNPSGPLPVVLPLVVSHAIDGWTAPNRMVEMFAPSVRGLDGVTPHLPQFEFLVEDITHLSDDDISERVFELYTRLVLWLLRDARSATSLMAKLPAWAASFSAAMAAPNGQEALQQLFRYIAEVTDEMHFDSFRAKLVELAPEVEPAAMTIAEELISRGKAEGRAEGRAEGARDALAATLSRLLLENFGPVPSEVQASIDAAATPQLEAWLSRMFGADSITAVFGDA